MKIIKIIANTFTVSWIVVILLATIFPIKETKNIKDYKYTIRIGSPAFSIGIKTDTFSIDKDFIIFKDTDNNKRMYSINSLYEIEKNECNKKK